MSVKNGHIQQGRPGMGGVISLGVAAFFCAYFAFAAIGGEFGIFRQAQIRAEAGELQAERDRLQDELSRQTNLTLRLSDRYLDLDLLDERARDVLGFVRADEIVLR